MAEQDWTEAGVSSSDRTQLTSRLKTPTNVKSLQSVSCVSREEDNTVLKDWE